MVVDKQSRIREALNLTTCPDSRTSTELERNGQKRQFLPVTCHMSKSKPSKNMYVKKILDIKKMKKKCGLPLKD